MEAARGNGRFSPTPIEQFFHRNGAEFSERGAEVPRQHADATLKMGVSANDMRSDCRTGVLDRVACHGLNELCQTLTEPAWLTWKHEPRQVMNQLVGQHLGVRLHACNGKQDRCFHHVAAQLKK